MDAWVELPRARFARDAYDGSPPYVVRLSYRPRASTPPVEDAGENVRLATAKAAVLSPTGRPHRSFARRGFLSRRCRTPLSRRRSRSPAGGRCGLPTSALPPNADVEQESGDRTARQRLYPARGWGRPRRHHHLRRPGTGPAQTVAGLPARSDPGGCSHRGTTGTTGAPGARGHDGTTPPAPMTLHDLPIPSIMGAGCTRPRVRRFSGHPQLCWGLSLLLGQPDWGGRGRSPGRSQPVHRGRAIAGGPCSARGVRGIGGGARYSLSGERCRRGGMTGPARRLPQACMCKAPEPDMDSIRYIQDLDGCYRCK